MRARSAFGAIAALALIVCGCGGSPSMPIGIGILSDCYGAFSSAHELILASAELPLIERGGRLRGKTPTEGVDGASVAGHPIDLSVGCVTGTDEVIRETRRLVEENGVAVVVGPLFPDNGLVVRDYARRRPLTTFIVQPSGAQEVTLSKPAANVFRFAPTTAQSEAGLGAYAYHKLGWRTAVTLADDTPYGWGTVAGIVAEFCSLGGRIVDRRWAPPGAPTGAIAGQLPRSVDGVFVGGTITPMLPFVQGYAARKPDLARHLVADAVLLYDPKVVAMANGVVAAGAMPFTPTAAMQSYTASFEKAFPTLPAASALNPLAFPYRDAVEAALEALEASGGATGAPLMLELRRLALESPAGLIRLDSNRQAIEANYLVRVAVDPKGKPAFPTVRTIPDVEQTFGGYFKPTDPPPNRTMPACVKRTPPPWARR